MRREDVLEYEKRRHLYALVRDEPGLHLRELERRSGLPLGTLRHHLEYLMAHRLVESAEDRNVTRFFVTDLDGPTDRRLLGALRQESLRRVLLHMLREEGPIAHRALQEGLGLPPSTLAAYLAQLTRRGILQRRVAGRESRYEVVDRERIIRLLHTFRASFLDEMVDHLLDLVYQDEP